MIAIAKLIRARKRNEILIARMKAPSAEFRYPYMTQAELEKFYAPFRERKARIIDLLIWRRFRLRKLIVQAFAHQPLPRERVR